MIRKIPALTVIVLMASVLLGQQKTVTITGNLIDNACAESAKDLDTRAKNHPTSCALMEKCQSSGYAVYADHKLYKLDDKGNDSAAGLLKNTKTTKGVGNDIKKPGQDEVCSERIPVRTLVQLHRLHRTASRAMLASTTGAVGGGGLVAFAQTIPGWCPRIIERPP